MRYMWSSPEAKQRAMRRRAEQERRLAEKQAAKERSLKTARDKAREARLAWQRERVVWGNNEWTQEEADELKEYMSRRWPLPGDGDDWQEWQWRAHFLRRKAQRLGFER